MLRSFLFLLFLVSSADGRAEEIPLGTCDRLPVVQVTIGNASFLFLLDTGATSMLNLKSFAHGDPRNVSVTSWSGTVETKAQDITLADFVIGQHHLKNLRLPAVDLSAIGHACGKRIDGVLGVDLLTRLGATVDIKNHTAQLLPDDKALEARVAELEEQLSGCDLAFNRADEKTFTDCLDPQIVTFTVGGDFYGRDAIMEYYRNRYFHQNPPAQVSLVPRAHHLIGDAIWMEYDLKIDLHGQTMLARGTALCRKSEGRWRIVHMNHSNPPVEAQPGTKVKMDTIITTPLASQ
jgi:ketosteroid isomerase-like protein